MSLMKIKIIAQTDDYIVVNKPAGIESEHGVAACLDDDVTYYCVHRLDTPTSGLIVYGKNKAFANHLSKQIQSHQLHKTYLAVVKGRIDDQGEMADYLYRDRRAGKSYVVNRQRKGVKAAHLSYQRLAYDETNDLSLVKIHLDTGRFHQIRCQFASRAMPLVGDGKYGSRVKASHLALCNCELSFMDYKERVTFTISPPDESPWTLFDMINI